MMKKLVYISILSLLLLSSCRSKRMITVSLPQPVMQADSAQLGDTIGLPARLSPMFTFDQSDLRNVRRQPAKGRAKKQQIKKTAPVQTAIVQRGTRITSKTTHVGSAYKGVSRIKTYDFTHRLCLRPALQKPAEGGGIEGLGPPAHRPEGRRAADWRRLSRRLPVRAARNGCPGASEDAAGHLCRAWQQ